MGEHEWEHRSVMTFFCKRCGVLRGYSDGETCVSALDKPARAMTLGEVAAETNSIAVEQSKRDDPATLMDNLTHLSWETARNIGCGATKTASEGITSLVLECLYVASLIDIDIDAAVQARLAEARAAHTKT